jgi:hypothetical protein
MSLGCPMSAGTSQIGFGAPRPQPATARAKTAALASQRKAVRRAKVGDTLSILLFAGRNLRRWRAAILIFGGKNC